MIRSGIAFNQQRKPVERVRNTGQNLGRLVGEQP
jgi:hypothetical protein